MLIKHGTHYSPIRQKLNTHHQGQDEGEEENIACGNRCTCMHSNAQLHMHVGV